MNWFSETRKLGCKGCPPAGGPNYRVQRAIASASLLRYLCFSATVGLVGCTSMSKVGYDSPASVQSSYSADVTLVSGVITGDPFVGVIYPIPVPITRQPPRGAMFNADDQKMFVASLIDEFSRLKILNARAAADIDHSKADVSIQVSFVRTHVRDIAVDTYTLNVDLQMCVRDRCTSERYDVNSSEGETTSSHLSITFAEAKERVARKLLAKVIPSIEIFVSGI